MYTSVSLQARKLSLARTQSIAINNGGFIEGAKGDRGFVLGFGDESLVQQEGKPRKELDLCWRAR